MKPNIKQTDLLNALYRQGLGAFTQKTFNVVTGGEVYKHAPYIDLIVQHLEACESGKIKRLLITVPPRYLKSISASVAFPAWVLGRNPNAKIIQASYAQGLSNKHARDMKSVIEDPFYARAFPDTQLLPTPNTQSEIQTTQMGSRFSTSVGGTLTGRGADFIIIDDPLKPDEAHSDVSRQNVNDWYDNTLLSRLNDKENGCIIIIMQRLHEDDLVGHVLEQEDWVHLNLPALAEDLETYHVAPNLVKSYIYTREKRDALHPERESAEKLIKLRDKIIGPLQFASQYQQSPAPSEGGIVKLKWFKEYDELPSKKPDRIIQSLDTASKSEEIHDYSVCTTWYEYGDDIYLVDVLRKRLEFPDLLKTIKSHVSIYNPHFILIEDKGSGTSLIQYLKQERLPIQEIQPQGDKIMRMSNQTPQLETGKVFLPKQEPWLADFKNEVMKFPKAKHDDQIDSMSQALQWIHEKKHQRLGFPKSQLRSFKSQRPQTSIWRTNESLW